MYEQIDMFFQGSTGSPDHVKKALSWIDGSWSAFWKLIEICEKEKACGTKRIRRGDLYILAQLHGLSVTVSKEYRFDNNVWAAVSRYMLMVRPSLADVIHPNESPNGIDLLDLCREWRNFNWSNKRRASLFFLCERWQDARSFQEPIKRGAQWAS